MVLLAEVCKLPCLVRISFLSFFHCSADLQNAIEEENYVLAAELRDQILKLEAESLAASAKALAHENAQYLFRLGQKVKHKIYGINALILFVTSNFVCFH